MSNHSNPVFDSPVDMISALYKQGYRKEFKIEGKELFLLGTTKKFSPESISVHLFKRFEDDSSADSTVEIWAIESPGGHKGILVDAVNMYGSDFLANLMKNPKK